MDFMLLDQVHCLEQGRAHLDAKILNFLTAGDDAAVIVGQDHNGLVLEIRTKQSLTAHIKVIGIDKGESLGHGLRRLCITVVATPKMSRSAPSGMTIGS